MSKINILGITNGNNSGVEEWKDIPGYENKYQCNKNGEVKSLPKQIIYSDGRIYNYKETILKGSFPNTGYKTFRLNNKDYNCHILIAMTFLNYIPKKGLVINHIDGNKLNNRLDNLEIVTHRENLSICYRKNENIFSSKYIGVSWNKKCNKWRAGIKIDGKSYNLGDFINEIDASEAYNNKLKELKNGK